MKVGTGGNLGLSREYPKKLFWLVLFMVELSFNFLPCSSTSLKLILTLAEGEREVM